MTTFTAPRTGIATPAEVAEYRRMSVQYLAQERYIGRGPRYSKQRGRAITYRWEDVHEYIESTLITPGE